MKRCPAWKSALADVYILRDVITNRTIVRVEQAEPLTTSALLNLDDHFVKLPKARRAHDSSWITSPAHNLHEALKRSRSPTPLSVESKCELVSRVAERIVPNSSSFHGPSARGRPAAVDEYYILKLPKLCEALQDLTIDELCQPDGQGCIANAEVAAQIVLEITF